ncbi:MAG TPA: CDP-alcohol phosphatidyltransferase family protein [bacterium]|nr:CDP-alcohol phosphatidyltransferase family protein [bacterium]HPS29074.1 CDP-alcohol phosphatidyltransferase family protein [bacterium]
MRLIHLKDIATLGNIAIGFGSSILAIEGHITDACYLMIAAFVFDMLDGNIARWTKMSNQFGKELDTIADHVTYSVCPSFIVYAFYRELGVFIALTMGLVPVIFGCIRHARNQVYDISFPRFWLGTPRPVSAFYIVAVIGTQLAGIIPYYKWIAIPVIFWIGYNNLSFRPFLAHHGRKFNKPLKFFMSAAVLVLFLSGVATGITGKPWLLDCLLFEMIVYTFFTPLAFDPWDLDGYAEYVKKKKEEIAKDMQPQI